MRKLAVFIIRHPVKAVALVPFVLTAGWVCFLLALVPRLEAA